MVAMRKIEDCLIVDAIVHRRDIPTVINCLKSGVKASEYLLYNARLDFEMMCAIVFNSSHVIEIKSGMIFTFLCMNFKDNRDKLWFILMNCKVSVGCGLSTVVENAICHGDIEMTWYICNNWDIILTTPLVLAAKQCQYDILKFILSLGIFSKTTLDVALCDAIFYNVEVAKREQLKKVVALLCNNGATVTTSLLKMCAYNSIIVNDFLVITTLLSFFDLKFVIMHIEEFANAETTINMWLECIADAFRLQKAAKKIVHGFRVNRRLYLARGIYSNKSIYTPALTFAIAMHGGLV
jgi:hypothetical protein